ncbi:MAG TPA: hypothetical protein PKG48_16110 [Bacteroidales bacterium]|nr:hypothetical protein [Bacteroidales bacterium]HPS62379.1 hypothetical protein [Bacteroidales bacterium]
MKKFAIALAALLMMAPAVFPSAPGTLAAAPTGVWIKFELNLHRPKLGCERGFGLCLIVTTGFNTDNLVSKESGLLPVRGRVNERNQLVVEISEEALTKYERGSSLPFFRNRNSITIQDPYEVPEPVCRSLGISFPRFVKPGTCPVTYQNGVYTVTFQL